MDIPAVRYLKTVDGVDIAYTVSGKGKPFVFLPAFMNHVQDVWRGVYSCAALLRGLAERFQLVNFDSRGMGMSTRGLPEDLSLDDYLEDVDAVVEQVGLDRFPLLGSCQSAFLAAHYALRYPERVSALVLINGAVSWDAWRLSSVYEKLPEEDWELFLYNLVPHDRPPDVAYRMVEVMKQAMVQKDYLVSARVWQTAGLEGLLPRLQVPTLVLHSRDFRLRSVEGPQELTRKLPNARLVMMDGLSLFGQRGQAVEAIDHFLTDLEAGEPRPAVPASNGLAEHLTRREAQVLRLIADGQSNREVADELVLSLRTVERHITNIYAKIGARGRADATAYALRHSLA
jgi:pimeloyl-ACP methyl ester carboxylesterase/DNA-binding CsgD family transcriptional regulator